MSKEGVKVVARNRKAHHEYQILETWEAGLVLLGSEVKSLRTGQADLTGSYARIASGECWLVGAKITQYQQAGLTGHNPTRKRKLLLHKHEIRKIYTKLEQRGFTLVPLRIYFNNKGESPDKREVGVIAQEVERVLPEVVSEDAEGYKSVDYTKLTPLLIEAVKELVV